MALTDLSFDRQVLAMAYLLEGEGCFGYWNKTPGIRLAMTDLDTVEEAQKILGAPAVWTRARHGKHRPLYACAVAGAVAGGWMMMLYPFMHQRRKAKIREVLAQWRKLQPWQRYRKTCPQGHPYSGTKRGKQASHRICHTCIAGQSYARNRNNYWKQKADTQTAPLFD